MKETDRASVIGQVSEKRLGQREAAEQLGLSIRQVQRLLARYRERGSSGLVSGHLGKPSNNVIAASVRREAMGLVRERYPDFGPTFACEKLVEVHGLRLSAGDAAPVDGRGRAVAAEGASGGSRPPESSAPGVFRRLGAD